MTPEDPPFDEMGTRLLAVRLLESLGDLDLTSGDGRAGIGTLLSEIERLAPGAVLKQTAGIELQRLGWGGHRGSSLVIPSTAGTRGER